MMDPLPIWYPPFEDASVDTEEFPVHALTQRPMAMYHSWGTQNAWLRQIHGQNPLYLPTKLWEEHGFADGDWARVTSAHGEITVPVAHMAALNENTVWTWNAIGKRKGAWALSEDAPEATRGFLLNHLIHELAAAQGRRASLVQLRSHHRPGGVVRSAGEDREIRGPGRGATGLHPDRIAGGKGPEHLEWKVGK